MTEVPPKLVAHLLQEIDEVCEPPSSKKDVCISRGPFDVFTATPSYRKCIDPEFETEVAGQSTSDSVLRFNCESNLMSESCEFSPATQALFSSIFKDSGRSPSPVSPQLWNLDLDVPRMQEIFDDQDLRGLPNLTSSTASLESHFHYPYPTPAFLSDPQIVPPILPDPQNPLISANNAIPANAVFLLSHYSRTVMNFLTPFRHTKTPWHILFIPHVKSCLAAMAMGEQIDHASLCTFYGTLALSALSMSGITKSQMWLEEGKMYKDRARHHVRIMLQTAYNVPKTAKYKCILMALHTMVQVSLFNANPDQTECYFLEAEKFIRLRGLMRRKSRKVRLLHHCYVFERLLYESISISRTSSHQRVHVVEVTETSGVNAYGQDSPSFRLPKFQNLDTEMQRAKSQEEGENDLFLERIGDFPATLYPEVFGVPESCMLMLSLVIRLGKVKDAAQDPDHTGPSSPKDYLAQAKAIERSILRMRDNHHARTALAHSNYDNNKAVMDNMLAAFHEALAIYFYRRIYDLDPALLQGKVVAVRDSLLCCVAAAKDAVCGSAGFIWPAFIAACEAQDVAVQVSFTKLFNTVAQCSGLSKFGDTLQDIRQIWQEKSANCDAPVTWLDIMKRKTSSTTSTRCFDQSRAR